MSRTLNLSISQISMTSISDSQCSHLLPSYFHHDQVYIHPLLSSNGAFSSPCAIPFDDVPCQGGNHMVVITNVANHPPQQFGGSAHERSLPGSPPTTMDDEIRNKKSTEEIGGDASIRDSTSKWMPSKMRFARRMVSPNGVPRSNPRAATPKLQNGQQPFADGNSSSNGDGYNNSITTTNGRHHHHHRVAHSSVRVCSDCNTTKTPLWRSGPRGPKSLCNACGIRRIRKARRAMAAEALPDSVIPAIAVPAIAGKISDGEPCSYSFKKSCKLDSTQQKLQLDEFTLSLRKNEAFHRDFHQEEKEAAVLLMALSWGLIRG